MPVSSNHAFVVFELTEQLQGDRRVEHEKHQQQQKPPRQTPATAYKASKMSQYRRKLVKGYSQTYNKSPPQEIKQIKKASRKAKSPTVITEAPCVRQQPKPKLKTIQASSAPETSNIRRMRKQKVDDTAVVVEESPIAPVPQTNNDESVAVPVRYNTEPVIKSTIKNDADGVKTVGPELDVIKAILEREHSITKLSELLVEDKSPQVRKLYLEEYQANTYNVTNAITNWKLSLKSLDKKSSHPKRRVFYWNDINYLASMATDTSEILSKLKSDTTSEKYKVAQELISEEVDALKRNVKKEVESYNPFLKLQDPANVVDTLLESFKVKQEDRATVVHEQIKLRAQNTKRVVTKRHNNSETKLKVDIERVREKIFPDNFFTSELSDNNKLNLGGEIKSKVELTKRQAIAVSFIERQYARFRFRSTILVALTKFSIRIRRAAISIQRIARGRLARKRLAYEILVTIAKVRQRHACAYKIQNCFREFEKARRFARAQEAYDINIRNAADAAAAREALRSSFETPQARKARIEAYRKLGEGRRKEREELKRKQAALDEKEKQVRNNAATVIQARARGLIHRRVLAILASEEAAEASALKIQSLARGRNARRRVAEFKFNRQYSAAKVIQSRVRGVLARNHVLIMQQRAYESSIAVEEYSALPKIVNSSKEEEAPDEEEQVEKTKLPPIVRRKSKRSSITSILPRQMSRRKSSITVEREALQGFNLSLNGGR